MTTGATVKLILELLEKLMSMKGTVVVGGEGGRRVKVRE